MHLVQQSDSIVNKDWDVPDVMLGIFAQLGLLAYGVQEGLSIMLTNIT